MTVGWPVNLHVAPESGMIAPDSCGWTPLWSERHSGRYDLSEQPVQACLDQRGPGWILGRSPTVPCRKPRKKRMRMRSCCIGFRYVAHDRLVQHAG